MKKTESIPFPIARKAIPNLLAEDLATVQPLSSSTGSIFKSRQSSESYQEFGHAIHSFIEGWCVAVSKEKYIPFDQFIDRYGTEPIVPDNMRIKLSQWYYFMRSTQPRYHN